MDWCKERSEKGKEMIDEKGGIYEEEPPLVKKVHKETSISRGKFTDRDFRKSSDILFGHLSGGRQLFNRGVSLYRLNNTVGSV